MPGKSKLTFVQFFVQMVFAYEDRYPGEKAEKLIPMARTTYLDFLRDEKIEFGAPGYDWSADGAHGLVKEYAHYD